MLVVRAYLQCEEDMKIPRTPAEALQEPRVHQSHVGGPGTNDGTEYLHPARKSSLGTETNMN